MHSAFSRRSFLATTALGMASGCVRREGDAPPPDGSVQPTAEHAEQALGPRTLGILEAAMARILPSDEDPGAKEARCVEFLRTQLEDPQLAAVKREMHLLARVLEAAAKKATGGAFPALTAVEQDEILGRAAEGKLPHPRGFDVTHAFRVLVSFTLEGFLSDPRHGGNAGGVGWKFAQFEPHAGHAHHGLPVVDK
ncbi:MAG: gluconate 2-dehydrogenase subunit 3 family protein [Myxococcota bacterium]